MHRRHPPFHVLCGDASPLDYLGDHRWNDFVDEDNRVEESTWISHHTPHEGLHRNHDVSLYNAQRNGDHDRNRLDEESDWDKQRCFEVIDMVEQGTVGDHCRNHRIAGILVLHYRRHRGWVNGEENHIAVNRYWGLTIDVVPKSGEGVY